MRPTLLLLACVAFLLGGCRSSALSKAERSAIPADAAAVVLTSDLPPGELYAEARKRLNNLGFIMADTDESQLVLVTEKMGVGKTMTVLRLVSVVDRGRNGDIRLVLSGEYELPPDGFSRARNRRSQRNRAAMAFEEIVVIAQGLPHTDLSYWTYDQLDRAGYGDRRRFFD
jgi:hypothetical protein